MNLTLGSLFDGIGGFPYAANLHGITPVWASEIETAPVSVTKRHFPGMRHLGDVTEIDGSKIEPVDIITFGSPCQDLSVAGKRAGLEGERSGLFMEAVRIIKEMRDATGGTRPRFCVWENVPGAFSSNGGEDFRVVVAEIAKIADNNISISRPSEVEGRIVWGGAGAVMGDGWSLAWRVLDAQYWGVPQRRKRIFLVADFGGGRADEIPFKPESLPGDFAEGGPEGEGTAANAGSGVDKNVIVLNEQGGGRNDGISVDVSPILRAGTHGHLPVVFDARGNGCGSVAPCIIGAHKGHVSDHMAVVAYTPSSFGQYSEGAGTLKAEGGDLGGGSETLVATFARQSNCEYKASDKGSTMQSRDYKSETDLISTGHAVRRLTPTECERLQGFPDGWTAYGEVEATETNHKKHGKNVVEKIDDKTLLVKISDTTRYRALGNSVAVPCVSFIMGNIARAASGAA